MYVTDTLLPIYIWASKSTCHFYINRQIGRFFSSIPFWAFTYWWIYRLLIKRSAVIFGKKNISLLYVTDFVIDECLSKWNLCSPLEWNLLGKNACYIFFFPLLGVCGFLGLYLGYFSVFYFVSYVFDMLFLVCLIVISVPQNNYIFSPSIFFYTVWKKIQDSSMNPSEAI